MKARNEVARRYARALFGLSSNGKREAVLVDLRKVFKLIDSDKQTYQLVSSPVITRREKKLVVEKILENSKLLEEVANFIRLLAQKDRLSILDQILQELENISDEQNNVMRGTVVSAANLTDNDKKAIEEKVEKTTQRQAILDFQTDKNLLGGIVVNVGSYSFDGSLKTQLRKLREVLKT